MKSHEAFGEVWGDNGPRLDRVCVAGVELAVGDPVRLRPKRRADIMDLALEGRTAVIASLEQDFEERVYVVVVVDDDPGREWGAAGQPGHRFFFAPDEVELLPRASAPAGGAHG